MDRPQRAGSAFVYLAQVMDHDRVLGSIAAVVVKIPEKVYTQRCAHRTVAAFQCDWNELGYRADWNDSPANRAYITQWRWSGQKYDASPSGGSTAINASGGNVRAGSGLANTTGDGVLRYFVDGIYTWYWANSKYTVKSGL